MKSPLKPWQLIAVSILLVVGKIIIVRENGCFFTLLKSCFYWVCVKMIENDLNPLVLFKHGILHFQVHTRQRYQVVHGIF